MKNHGFTLIEVVVVVVVAVLIGGWVYSWQRAQEAANQEAAATPTPTATASVVASSSASLGPTADPYVGWKTYTQANGYYSFKYPADWKVDVVSHAGADNVSVYKGNTQELLFLLYRDGGSSDNVVDSRTVLLGSTTVILKESESGQPYIVPMTVESVPHGDGMGKVVWIEAQLGHGQDRTIMLILGSVNGLIPMSMQ